MQAQAQALTQAETCGATGRFLRLRDVMAATGLSRSTIYRRMQRGAFPKSIQLGPRTTVWLEAEVQAWMGQAIAEARGGGR